MSSTSSPPTDTSPASNAQASTPPTPPHVQALQLLTTRLDAFEHDLQSAISSEHNFHQSLQALSTSLESLVTAHRFEHEHLSRLIAIDTQRSQQARDEYEMLAGRFRDALGDADGGFGWELIRIVWLYVGIGLSVVMMAPLHLVLYVVEGVMSRLGWRASADEKKTRGRGKDGTRDATRDAERKGRRRHVGASSTAHRDSASGTTGREIKASAAETVGPRKPLEVDVGLAQLAQAQVEKAVSRSDDEDEFFDAMGAQTEEAKVSKGNELGDGQLGTDGHAGDSKGVRQDVVDDVTGDNDGGDKEDDGVAESGEDERPRRPEWAIPQDSVRMEMGRFPSNDFWDLPKEDDMYMSFLKDS